MPWRTTWPLVGWNMLAPILMTWAIPNKGFLMNSFSLLILLSGWDPRFFRLLTYLTHLWMISEGWSWEYYKHLGIQSVQRSHKTQGQRARWIEENWHDGTCECVPLLTWRLRQEGLCAGLSGGRLTKWKDWEADRKESYNTSFVITRTRWTLCTCGEKYRNPSPLFFCVGKTLSHTIREPWLVCFPPGFVLFFLSLYELNRRLHGNAPDSKVMIVSGCLR